MKTGSQGLTRLLGTRWPLVQAPMAGGLTPPALIAAACNAGALGSLGAAYLTPEQLVRNVEEIRRLTDRPFAVNLFAGGWTPPAAGAMPDAHRILELLAPLHARFGLPPPTVPDVGEDPFPAQWQAALDARVPILSFTMGIPPPEALAAARRAGTVLIGTATTVREGVLLQEAGVDAIAAQGSEAGGHRGTFATRFESGLVGTLALVPQLVDAVRLPVIASGGIMDGRGMAASLMLGASGVQLGTAFLTCDESTASAAYKEAVRTARDDSTVITRAFSGRPARGLSNAFIESMRGQEDSTVLPFPTQNSLTRPLRNAAASQQQADYMSLWAGQAAGMSRSLPTAELVHRLVSELQQVLRERAPATLAEWSA